MTMSSSSPSSPGPPKITYTGKGGPIPVRESLSENSAENTT